MIIGGFTCAKQIGSVYLGLGLSYLALVANALSANLCGVIFIILAVLQAHRVIRWAKKLTALGIPLTAMPYDFHASGGASGRAT